MATLSQFNNTNVPLLVGQTFTGGWERSLRNLELTCFVNSSGYALLTIEQSVDASNVRIPTSFNYTPTTDVSTFSTSIGLPYFRVKLLNVDIGTQAYLSLNTYLIPTPPSQVQVSGSTSTAITSPLDASGNVKVAVKNTIPISTTISGVVDVSGSVISTPALNSAQLRTLPLVVGHWYQVASVGNTPGFVWAEMGAIVGGESLPPVGRQFQCLYAGYGTGTCYDITAPVNTSGTANVNVVNDVSCNIVFPLYNDLVAVSVNGWETGATIPVAIDTDQNTIKIDQANNGVKVNPTAQAPVRVTGLGDTAKSVGGPGLLYGISYQNKSSTVNCWVKLYDKATAPTASDTPFLIQYIECVQQYNLSHNSDDCYNAPIANTLWVRASLLPVDNDSTDTGIDAEITAFVGS